MRSELYKYTREEIIEAIEHVCKEPSKLYIRSMIISRMNDVREEARQNKFDELTEQCNAVFKEYLEAHKKYNSYLVETAKKYNILNDDNTFKIYDWFKVVTEEEMAAGLTLGRDMKKKYEEYNRLHRAMNISLGVQKGYHEKKS